MTRIALQRAAREGSVQLLSDYCASVALRAQIYRARPKQAKPPTFYVESMTTSLTPFTEAEAQQTIRVTVRGLWGKYDDGDAVDQRDTFVDGFVPWVQERPRAFDANSDLNLVAIADVPEFDFDGGEPYFSTAIALEGFAST